MQTKTTTHTTLKPFRLALLLFTVSLALQFISGSQTAKAVNYPGWTNSMQTRSSVTGQCDIVNGAFGNYDTIPPGSTGSFSMTIPGSSIHSAYLYWAERIDLADTPDPNVDFQIDAGPINAITPDDTYGATQWVGNAGTPAGSQFGYVYVRDVTSLLTNNTATYTMSNFDTPGRYYGFGIQVIYCDNSLPERYVELVDGFDAGYRSVAQGYAYGLSPEDPTSAHCVNIPVDLNFSRSLDIVTFIGGVDTPDRTQDFLYETGSGATPSTMVGSGTATKVLDPHPIVPVPSLQGFYPYTQSGITVGAGESWACMQLDPEDPNDADGNRGLTGGGAPASVLSFSFGIAVDVPTELDLTIVQTPTGTFERGSTNSICFVGSNLGDSASPGATRISVTLDEDLEFDSGLFSDINWTLISYNPLTNTAVFENANGIASGGSLPAFCIDVTVTNDAIGALVINSSIQDVLGISIETNSTNNDDDDTFVLSAIILSETGLGSMLPSIMGYAILLVAFAISTRKFLKVS